MLRLIDWIRHRVRLRRWAPGQAVGRRGEDLAHRYLRARGLVVAARNFRPRSGPGEVDLVCWDRQSLVFVEVKTRTTDEYGEPDRAIDAGKRKALVRCAREYARRAGVPWDSVRFDVVDVVLGERARIEHVRDAFPSCAGAAPQRADNA